MAEAPYPLTLRESDRPQMMAWLARCQQLGVLSTRPGRGGPGRGLAESLRLAVKLAECASDEEIAAGELRPLGEMR